MALIVLILLMALIRIMLRITDRGSLERAILSRRRFADPIVTSYETMAGQIREDEMPFEFDAVAERLDPGARGRISRAYGARVVILAALCQGAAVVGLAPTWVLAVIPAASTFVLPALDAELLARQGRTAPPAKTPAQKSVELVANLMCGALAWPAFYLCFERGDNPVPVALAAYALLLAAYLARRLGMRLAQRFASPQFEKSATRDTVLYLRSFSDDRKSLYSPVTDGDLRSLLWPRISFEEFVSYCAGAACGNLITIGRPGERLPRAGAWRSYFEDDAWQKAVRTTMLRCGTILLTVGSTEALGWEIRHIKKWGMLNKCVFLVPPLPKEQFRRRLELALDTLEVGEDKRSREILDSAPFVTGFRILSGGSIQWLLCSGRDWGAYFFSISRATGAASRRLREHAHGNDEAEAAENVGERAAHQDDALEQTGFETRSRQKPLAPPRPVAKVARMTLRAGMQFEADEANAQTVAQYQACLDETLQKDKSSPEALMYLRIMCLRCKIRSREWRTSELIPEMEQLARDSAGMPLIWISPAFEVLSGDEFRAWVLGMIAYAQHEMGAEDKERDAWARCFESAARAGNVLRAIKAQLSLATLGRDAIEMREHAEQALELADGISDARLAAEARQLLARAQILDSQEQHKA